MSKKCKEVEVVCSATLDVEKKGICRLLEKVKGLYAEMVCSLH